MMHGNTKLKKKKRLTHLYLNYTPAPSFCDSNLRGASDREKLMNFTAKVFV